MNDPRTVYFLDTTHTCGIEKKGYAHHGKRGRRGGREGGRGGCGGWGRRKGERRDPRPAYMRMNGNEREENMRVISNSDAILSHEGRVIQSCRWRYRVLGEIR